ncbi:Integral membrane sensor signal transduction histidine kinase [Candidatus Sulfopaludibacter sp. SbA3]|nr:Integral membrane sensor signal transduction histidine kinase [Candidatus Sulfopaludibacter sp. SbA3]
MSPQRITHQNIFRVLLAGFGLVIALLLAAAVVGVRNIDSIQQNAASLVREQAVTNRLIDELHNQQTSLTEVFSILARDPDSVDYDHIMNQLAEAGHDIDRISAEGAQTPERELWTRLRQSSMDFSQEARRILSVENPETFRSLDLFRDHEAFIAVVARLIESEYRKVSQAQAQIDRQSARLLNTSFFFAAVSVLLSLVFAAVTVRMVVQLIREMDWQTAELGRVSWHMLEDQEATARRFSHELHDELGQSLTAVKTNLAALGAGGQGNSARLEDCLHLVDEAIGNVRQMSQLLRPTILDDFGLEAGVRWLVEGFSARTGLDVDFDSNYAGRLPDETETHLFRIAQEALTNIARHAGAKKVGVRLASRGREIRLSIQDDGRGLPATAPMPLAPPDSARRPATLGMSGMRARARSAGGDLTVRSRPGEGVLIEVRVPLNHETHPNPAG